MPDVRTREGQAEPPPHEGDAAAGKLTAALARQGFDRADDHGGLAVRGHRSSDGGVWLTLGGRLSGASAARLMLILDAAPVTGSDALTAWRAGEPATGPGGLRVPPLGSVVLDSALIDRPGRVEDWDGLERLTLRPPVGGDPWTARLGDVRAVDADVDTRQLER
jgi:hypothetical protein